MSTREMFREFAQKNQGETSGDFAQRNILQHAARVGELGLGLPGGIQQEGQRELQELGKYLPESLTPSHMKNKSIFDKQESEGEENKITDFIMNPPSPQEIRKKYTPKIAKSISGKEDYLEPKNQMEEAAGQLTQDIASFFLPGTGQMRLATRLGAPIFANLVKEGIKYFGGEESTAEKAKMGIMLASTIAGQSNPGRYASESIKRAKEMIPENAVVNVRNLANNLMNLYTRVTRGISVPSKSRATQGMRDLAGQVDRNNNIGLHSLMDARDNINEWIAEAGGWDVPAPTRDASIRNLNELKTQVIRSIEQGISANSPRALDLYNGGYEAAAVNHRSNAIANFVSKHFGKNVASLGVKFLFPSLAGGAAFIPKTAIGIAAGIPVYNFGKVMYRISNSPTLAQYYRDVLLQASRGNAAAMVNSMDKLDEAMYKDEKKQGRKKSVEEFKQRFLKKE